MLLNQLVGAGEDRRRDGEAEAAMTQDRADLIAANFLPGLEGDKVDLRYWFLARTLAFTVSSDVAHAGTPKRPMVYTTGLTTA
jgi:hypothetical protein